MSKGSRLRAGFSVLAVATASLALAATAGAASGGGVVIQAQDACDPATFPPGFCTRTDNSGPRVTFDEINAEMARKGGHGAWRMTPDRVKVKRGESVVAVMGRGGELHTFTDVTETGFTPGCVPEINQVLFGKPDLGPACSETDPVWGLPKFPFGTGLLPGVSIVADTTARGTRLYECLVHPWMTATVTVG
jgi:hypothetical protein